MIAPNRANRIEPKKKVVAFFLRLNRSRKLLIIQPHSQGGCPSQKTRPTKTR